jgi:hypothetical protein
MLKTAPIDAPVHIAPRPPGPSLRFCDLRSRLRSASDTASAFRTDGQALLIAGLLFCEDIELGLIRKPDLRATANNIVGDGMPRRDSLPDES